MLAQKSPTLFLVIVFSIITGGAYAQMKTPDRAQDQTEETIYGWQLMSEHERAEHRAQMRALKTEAEREQFRKTHHEKMQQRAKERGITLPEQPREPYKDKYKRKDRKNNSDKN